MTSKNQYDAIVIGAGFAGLTAARDLSQDGNRVLLLEARDRLGGRSGSTVFPGTDVNIEMGGQFILDDKTWPGLARELNRYEVEIHHIPPARSYPTILNGKRNPGPFPVPPEQMFDMERAAIYSMQAAARIQVGTPLDHQDLGDLDIPLTDFLAPLDLPRETYDLVSTVFAMYAFRYPEEVSALNGLHSLACMNLSMLSMWGANDSHIRTLSLLERMAAEVTDVRLETPVARVDQTGEEVVVTTVEGESFSAPAAVIAIPMNVWNDIEFAPELSETKRISSAERHGTERAAKAWIRTRNGDPYTYVFAEPRSAGGVMMLYTEQEFDNGDELRTLFALASLEGDDYYLNFDERESVERALHGVDPGAELIDFWSHNYATDPYSKGDWVGFRPGRMSASHSVLGAPEGRLAFATADVAGKWLMFLEGAVESGHKAARHTINVLSREREASVVGGS